MHSNTGDWKIYGLFLFVWTTLGIAINNIAPPSHEYFQLYAMMWQSIVFQVACWTALRTSIGSALWTTVRTALLGYLPECVGLVLWATGVFYPISTGPSGPHNLFESRLALFATTIPTVPQVHFIDIPIVIAIVLLSSLVAGLIGGLLARIIQYFVPSLRHP